MTPEHQPHIYHICIAGHLDARWLRWFEGFQVTCSPLGHTEISGRMDQAALHGIFNRIRDLGMEILSVQREPNETWSDTHDSIDL